MPFLNLKSTLTMFLQCKEVGLLPRYLLLGATISCVINCVPATTQPTIGDLCTLVDCTGCDTPSSENYFSANCIEYRDAAGIETTMVNLGPSEPCANTATSVLLTGTYNNKVETVEQTVWKGSNIFLQRCTRCTSEVGRDACSLVIDQDGWPLHVDGEYILGEPIEIGKTIWTLQCREAVGNGILHTFWVIDEPGGSLPTFTGLATFELVFDGARMHTLWNYDLSGTDESGMEWRKTIVEDGESEFVSSDLTEVSCSG